MSWITYIQNLESGKGKCKYAAIYGKQGGVWGESADKSQFPVTNEEIAIATRAILNQDQSILGTGLTMGGHKFTCLLLEPDLLICQGKKEKKDYSLVVAASNQAIIVGFNPEADVKTASVREAVEVMRDYLKSCTY